MDGCTPPKKKSTMLFFIQNVKSIFFAYKSCLLPRFINSLLLFKLTRQMQNSINLNFFLKLIEYNLHFTVF